MSEANRCPQCNAEIPAAAPEGLCPQCLLQAGLESKPAEAPAQTAAYSPSGSGFVPPTPEVLQAAFPQLEILELLGKGGMGAVYKAKQRGLDRLVAVKILPPEYSRDPAFAERFLREAKALAMLSHPNIITIHDVGQAFQPDRQAGKPDLPASDGYCYFVMEFVDGVNLRQAMKAGQLKPAEALKIVPQICDALQFAHDEGIVHRDIKPENILLDKKGRVKIADFGLAKLLGKTAPEISLTGTQQVMGTLHYMAPEQLEGSRDVDHRADIYSLGVTFYEMLTGELPIGRFAAPSKKVQIDVRLDEVVLRSLEKEPELRYQHASEIKTEVEGIVSTPPAPAGATPDAHEDVNLTYAALSPGKKILVDFYRIETRADLAHAMAALAAMSELEQAVLENWNYKARAVKVYRQKTGAGVNEAMVAVEEIARKHGLRFPPVTVGAHIVAATVLVLFFVAVGMWVWVYAGLSPIIAIPIMLLFAIPSMVTAWKKWGTSEGYWNAVAAVIIILLSPVGISIVTFLIDPEPTLNRLYELTGATPGPHDALFVRILFWTGLGSLLVWLVWFLRKKMAELRGGPKSPPGPEQPERPSPREPGHRNPQASEIKPEVESIARAPASIGPEPLKSNDAAPVKKQAAARPQPSYARGVGIPMLIALGAFLVIGIAGLLFFVLLGGLRFADRPGPQQHAEMPGAGPFVEARPAMERQAMGWLAIILLPCGSVVFLGLTFLVLNIVWLIRRNTGGEALAAGPAQSNAPRPLQKAPERRNQQTDEIKTEMEAINRTPTPSREIPPGTEATSSHGAGLSPIILLEATSGWKRWLPLVFLAVGVIGFPTLLVIHLIEGVGTPESCVGGFICFGLILLSMIQSLLLKIRWTVAYRGHQITVEFKHGSASRRLMIDGLTAVAATGATSASGGSLWNYELRATIPHGQGIGDKIVCTVECGVILRCRIIALQKTPISPAPGPEAPTPPAAGGIPVSYYFKTLGLAALAWLLVPLLWNAREWGLAIMCLTIGAFIVWRARGLMHFLPASGERWRQRSTAYRGSNLVVACLLAALGVYFVFLAGYQTWERFHWNSMARTRDEFQRVYRGAEHHLLSKLPEFDKDIPRAELAMKEPNKTIAWNLTISNPPTLDLFAALTIWVSLIMGLFIITLVYIGFMGEAGVTGPWRMGWFWPSLGLGMATLAPLLPYGIILIIVSAPSGYAFIEVPEVVNDELPAAAAQLDEWAAEHGYESGDMVDGEIHLVPRGGKIATVQIRHLWRPNVFDRWEMTLRGLRSKAPDYAVTLIGSATVKQTVVLPNRRMFEPDQPAMLR